MTSVFDLLHPTLREALQEMGFVSPTRPQEQAVPPILQGEHVLVVAPTGSGKTEAAVLPVLHHLISHCDHRGISALYITPLRALNRDMLSRLETLCSLVGVRVEVRHGDTTQAQRRRQSQSPPDLLITTPETLQVMLTGRRLRQHLSSVRFVVVDEVHELAGSKRGAQLSLALERLVEVAGEFQRVGLSATLGNPELAAKFLVGTDRECRVVRVEMEKEMVFQVAAAQGDRELARRLATTPEVAGHLKFIQTVVEESQRVLIFVNTRQAAEVLASRFKMMELPVGVHHGSLSREARIEAEENFKNGRLRGLICTSSMELGIDIGEVDHVIQYMSPRQVSRLVQRVGRSGHHSQAVSRGTILALGADDILESLVITDQARKGKVEDVVLHENSLDVLANQVCAATLSQGETRLDRLHGVVKRAYSYRNLTLEELEEVVKEAVVHRLVYQDGDRLGRRRKGWQYFYDNLSMIPDERRFEVQNIVTGRSIGTLDEVFVVDLYPGAVFIARGEMWRVLEIVYDKNLLRVEPIQDPRGEVPSWTGEEIPVPFEVAMEVGRLRGQIADHITGQGVERAASWLATVYPTDLETARVPVELIASQLKKGHPVPTDQVVVIEAGDREVVINIPGGNRANETLGRALTALVGARLGGSVALETDPYRIRLTLPIHLDASYFQGLIQNLKPDHLKPILEKTLANTGLFRWKMVQTARKFGAISKDTEYEKVNLKKLLEVYHGTPIHREALREIFQENLDLASAQTLLERIQEGEIKLETGRISPLGEAGFRGGRDLVSPERADASIITALKNRILNDRVILFCTNCKKWESHRQVKNTPEQPECPFCQSRMIAALKPWETEEIKIARKKTLTREEKKRFKRVLRNASLVVSSGKTAIIALASRGIGPDTAARVIQKMREDETQFYRDILEAERNYAKNRRFWD